MRRAEDAGVSHEEHTSPFRIDPMSNTNSKVLIALMSVLTAIAGGVLLNLTSEIVVPLVVAWFLVQISHPVINLGEKLRLPHIVNVGLVFLLIFVLFSLGVNFAVSQVKESERIFAQYGGRLTQLMARIIDTLQIPDETLSLVALLKRYVGNISGHVINFSSQFVMTLCFLAFILLETPTVDRKIDRAFPGGNSGTIKRILDSISAQVTRYLVTMVFISLVTGFCVWASLAIIGVEFAAGWGVLAFFLNFIPTIGSIVATVPPVLMALLQFSPSFSEAIATLIVVGAIQMATGNVLGPKMLGDSLGLSPVVIMLSLLLWGMILGIPGAIISTPIAAIIKIVCENVPSLRPIGIMMGTGAERREKKKKA
jgi:predicted PurR-regulated permease PerM